MAAVPELTDVDTALEAGLVARAIPGSAFAAAFYACGPMTVTSVP